MSDEKATPKQHFEALKRTSTARLNFADRPVTRELQGLLDRYGHKWPDYAIEVEESFGEFGQGLLRRVLAQSPTIPEIMKTDFFGNEEWFYVGTLTRTDINSHALRAPNGGWLIILNAGVIQFMYNTARTLVLHYSISDSTGKVLAQANEDFSETTARILEMLRLYKGLGVPAMRTFPLEPSQLYLANKLATHAEQFILSHELARHLMGHTNQGDGESNTIAPMSTLSLWDEELEADRVGLRLVLEGCDPRNTIYAYQGVELSLQTTRLLELYTGVQETARPLAKTRLDEIRELVADRAQGERDRRVLEDWASILDDMFAEVQDGILHE